MDGLNLSTEVIKSLHLGEPILRLIDRSSISERFDLVTYEDEDVSRGYTIESRGITDSGRFVTEWVRYKTVARPDRNLQRKEILDWVDRTFPNDKWIGFWPSDYFTKGVE